MANWVFNWSWELEPSLTWTGTFPSSSEFELQRFYCRYHPPLYNLPWSAWSWPDTRWQIPSPPLKNKMFFREGVRKKGESTGLRGVPFSCQFVKLFWLLYIWKITRMAFPQKKVIFPGGGLGRGLPTKNNREKIGGNLVPRVLSYPSLRPLSLSLSLHRNR